jgi:hypothetical protein
MAGKRSPRASWPIAIACAPVITASGAGSGTLTLAARNPPALLERVGYVIERAADAGRNLVQLGAGDDEWGRDLQSAARERAGEDAVGASAERDAVGESRVIRQECGVNLDRRDGTETRP